MIWLKRLAITLTSLVVLILLLFWIAVGRLGSPTLLSFAASYVPELEIEEITGGLSSTLIVNGVSYQSDGIEMSAKRVELTLRWQCLVQFSVCADSLSTDGLSLSLSPSEAAASEGNENNQLIMLPMLVAIDSLSATNSQLRLPDETLVSLNSLQSEVRIYRRWRLLSPQLEGLAIQGPVQSVADTEPTAASFATRSDIKLEDIYIPVNAEISKLRLANAQFIQNGESSALTSLLFDGEINGHQVIVNSLTAEHQAGTFDAEAKVSLSNEFPLNANLRIRSKLADQPPLAISVVAEGTLEDLQLEIKTDSPIVSELKASVQPLKAELPIDLSFNWESFTQENLKPMPLSEITVSEGQLAVSGDIRDYQVTAKTAFKVPQLPSVVSVNLDSLANPERVRLNNLAFGLLSGTVTSSGYVNLADNMNWQASTRLADIDGQVIDNQLPTAIEGKLDYQGQWVDGKPNINLQKIDINATQQGFPLTIEGSGAYAAKAGIVVSSMRIAHKQNHIQGFARLLIDRRVDADIIVAIEALGESLPGFGGEIRGNLMVMGEPTAPNIEITLDATSITKMDELGNPFSLADTASLSVTGTHTDQTATLDYRRGVLDMAIKSEIALKETLWSASIEQASITYETLNAELADSTLVNFNPNTQQANWDDLCWEVNNEGIACIERVLHKDNNTNFSVRIEDMVIDDWLKLASTTLPVTTADAQFSALLTGDYSPADGLVANVDGEITDSDWQIGNREQNLVVSIDPARFKLNAIKNLIKSELVVISPAVGKVEVVSSFDITPKQQSIDAKIIASDVLLAPFAYLSEEINKLDGVFDADLKINGRLDAPKLNGSLQLKNGTVDIIRAPSVITDWNALVTFEDMNADYTSDFKLGGGVGELTGGINWQDGITLNADIDGERLNVQYQDIDVSFSPDVSVSYADMKLVADGSITVPKAKILLEGLPENAVTPSSDVHLRGEPEPTSLLDRAEVNLQIMIDPERLSQVELDAFGLTANLAGQMRVTTQPTIMGFGDLQIVNGEYRAYGQELLIRSGEVQFNGPLSRPLLFIEAIRDPQLTENGVIAGLVIDGVATQPNIRLFSEPAMDQSQNLTYLLTGRGDMSGSGVDNNAFAGLLIGLGVSNSGGLTGAMGDALGINDLQLTSRGSGKDTQVALTGSIGQNLTLEYGVGLESIPEVKLRYTLLPKLFVEATSGLEQSLMLYYEFAVGEIRQTQAATAEQSE